VRQLVERVRGVLLRPRQALPLTLAESGAPRAILPYVTLLAALGPLALFISDGLIGSWQASTPSFSGWVRAPVPALVELLLDFALGLGAWAGLALAMGLLAPGFGGHRDPDGARKAAAYTLTPLFIAAIALLFGSVPYFTWVGGVSLVAGVAWAAFVGVLALPLHLGTPEAKAPGHALAALGLTTVATTAVYVGASAAIQALWSARIR
jgi:hypothetical protein